MNSTKIVESFHLSKKQSKQVGINLSSKEINEIINKKINNNEVNIPSEILKDINKEIEQELEKSSHKLSSYKIDNNSPFNSIHPQKREFHSSNIRLNIISKKNNLVLTYLDSIEELINDSKLIKE